MRADRQKVEAMTRSAYVLGALSLALLIPQDPASAQSAFADPNFQSPAAFARVAPGQDAEEFEGGGVETPSRLRRQVVSYSTREAPGTIIVDTPNTYLYYVLGNGQAVRYGIGVGRDGFRWSGTQTIARKAEWPDWNPPAQMIARQPYLPRFMAGGPSNPMGARALYLGNSIYRIHGTNAPSTIGGRVSSGCIRMLNDDVVDLYGRVKVGSKVVVLPDGGRRLRDIAQPAEPRAPRQAARRAPEPVAPAAVATPAPAAAVTPQPQRDADQVSATRRTAATPTIFF
jgi:lipoprotein-anchoring transpeptidase ErfK/SrfK